jgi:hypothetical protein
VCVCVCVVSKCGGSYKYFSPYIMKLFKRRYKFGGRTNGRHSLFNLYFETDVKYYFSARISKISNVS